MPGLGRRHDSEKPRDTPDSRSVAGIEASLGQARATGYQAPDDVRYRPGGNNGVLRLALFEAWNQRYYWCDTPRRNPDIEIDHILPQAASPERWQEMLDLHGLAADFPVHGPANLAPIYRTYNREKSDEIFTGTLLTGKLRRAQNKQDQVIRQARAFTTPNTRWVSAVTADQRLTTPAEVALRIRQLTERAQDQPEHWRLDFSTTPEGIELRYTPRSADGVNAPEYSLPPLFDFPQPTPRQPRSRRA
jgi:hypothetical protein